MEKPNRIKKRGEVDENFVEVYKIVFDQINVMIKQGGLTMTNIDELIKAGMEAVETVSSLHETPLSGTQKAELAKNVIVSVLQHLGEKEVMDKNLSDGLVTAVETLGPVMFKLIVLAFKGKMSLGNGANDKSSTTCCTGCVVV